MLGPTSSFAPDYGRKSQTKSSPTASKTFGLQPKRRSNNTGTDKELAYGEQNVRLTKGASRPDKELAYYETHLR